MSTKICMLHLILFQTFGNAWSHYGMEADNLRCSCLSKHTAFIYAGQTKCWLWRRHTRNEDRILNWLGRVEKLISIAPPIGEFNCNFSAFERFMLDRPPNRPTEDRVIVKLHFQYMVQVAKQTQQITWTCNEWSELCSSLNWWGECGNIYRKR